MKSNFLASLIACLFVSLAFSQVNLNDYKYVIVSKKFDFLKQEDQYQLNSLAKFLFNKYGFEAFLEGDVYPQDLIENRCNALKAQVFSKPGILKSRLFLKLTDCNDKEVFTSEYGESRLKDFDKAYQDALREVFKHVAKLKHKYIPKEKSEPLSQNLANQDKVLYAKPIDNGFQVVDGTSKVVMILLASPKQYLFIVKDNNATVYQENGVWYYADSKQEKQVLNLKF